MVINLISWMPLLSLLCISFLYPLRLHPRNTTAIRVYASMFLFPAVISSIYLLNLVVSHDVIFMSFQQLPSLPILFGFKLDLSNLLLITSSTFLVATLIFLLPSRKLTENLSLASLTLALILIIAAASDHSIKMAAFAIGTIIITFMILNDEYDKYVIKRMTADFLIQRTSDLFAFIALLMLLNQKKFLLVGDLNAVENEITLTPRFLFFLAIVIKVISLLVLDVYQFHSPDAFLRNSVLRKMFLAVSSQIVLLHMSPIIVGDKNLDIYLITITGFVIVLSIIQLLISYKTISIADHVLNLLLSLSLLFIVLRYDMLTLPLICGIIIVYPLIALWYVINDKALTTSSRTTQSLQLSQSLITQIFLQLPVRFVYFFARLFIDFLNPFYAGFLLYRAPQIIVTTIQLPLRFFHNGNIQRSMLFISLMLIIYFYGWGK